MAFFKALRLTVICCAGLLIAAGAVPAGYGKDLGSIRVALLRSKPQALLAIVGSYELRDAATGALLKKGRNLPASPVALAADGIRIGREEWPQDRLKVHIRRRDGLRIDGRSYRGDLLILRDKDKGLLLVNVVDVEGYLKGVLVHEISSKWPMAALKAQAVAARTYALYQRETMKGKPYDVTADVSSQVYGGSRSEKGRTNRAVNFTAGEVLTYKGKLFPAYFHATCGGMTENASELWNISLAPLAGGRMCSFCSVSPHFFWKTALDRKTIREKLGVLYALKGPLASLAVAERTPTGRVRSLVLKDDAGRSVKISAKDFRQSLGPDRVRSTNFSISVDKDRFVFNGKGWGHGVGLCQWGASGMAHKGYDYEEILVFYYPGAALRRYDAL
ncbi:MAG: SpoIID/LytB domain-containing protein [Deltaproteobacteria bacterium]